MEWLDGINTFFISNRTIYFYLALGGSLIFVLQLILVLIGVSGATDVDADFDPSDVDMGGPGELTMVGFFSLRSIMAFITFFGWAGYLWGDLGLGGFVLAFIAGVVMMVLTTLAVWLILRLQQSGNLNAADFPGKTGTVYLSIPAHRAAGGQVTVCFKGCTRQVKAVADQAIASGVPVRVTEVIEPNCYLVEKI